MASPGVNLFDIDNERKSWRKSPTESPLRPCERKSWRKSPVESPLRPCERKTQRKSPAESPLRLCERESWRKSPAESLLGHGDGDYSVSSPESDCGRSRRKVYS